MPDHRQGDEGDGLDAAKRALRRAALDRRAGLAASSSEAGAALCSAFLETLPLAPFDVVSVFWPMAAEIDTLPLMTTLHEAGRVVVLPVLQGAGRPLRFRVWQPGDRLRAAALGTSEPGPDKAEHEPDLLAVPLLAFDRAGYRLGYGGGFYDRSLAALRAKKPVLAVGLAYAGQEVAAVPRGPHDQGLDWIVTERGAIRPTGGG